MSMYDDLSYERDELVPVVREEYAKDYGRNDVYFSNDLLTDGGIDIERMFGLEYYTNEFGDDISLWTREEYDRMTEEDLESWSILIDEFDDPGVQCVITDSPEVVVDTFDTLFPKYVEVYEDRFEVIEDLPTYLGEELASDLNWTYRKVKMDDSLSNEDIANSVSELVRPNIEYEDMNEFQQGMSYLGELNSYDLDRFMKALNEHLQVQLTPRFEEELKRSLQGSDSLCEEELQNEAVKQLRKLGITVGLPEETPKVDEEREMVNAYNLMPDTIKKQLPKLYSTEEQLIGDRMAYARYFFPMGGYTSYLLEYDPEERLGFGAVTMGRGWELGYISLDEMKEVKIHGLGIERDLHFSPTALHEITELKELVQGQYSEEVVAESSKLQNDPSKRKEINVPTENKKGKGRSI